MIKDEKLTKTNKETLPGEHFKKLNVKNIKRIDPPLVPKYRYNYINSTDNQQFATEIEYKPVEVIKRVFNEKTEQYEYKKEIINHALEWENELEMLRTDSLTEGE